MTSETSEFVLLAMDKIHEWSMSDCEHQAVTGRCLKQFYEQFDDFDSEECDRGIHRGTVIYGIVHAMGVIAATTALTGVKGGHERDATANVVRLFSDVVNDICDAKVCKRMEGEDS